MPAGRDDKNPVNGKAANEKSNAGCFNSPPPIAKAGKSKTKPLDLILPLQKFIEDADRIAECHGDHDVEETAIDELTVEGVVPQSSSSTFLMGPKRPTSHSLASHKSYYSGAWHGKVSSATI